MSIVVRGLTGTHLVVRGLVESLGALVPFPPLSQPFEATEAILALLFTTIDPGDRDTSATFGAGSMVGLAEASSADINKANTAIQSRPLTAVVHRTRTSVLVHGG